MSSPQVSIRPSGSTVRCTPTVGHGDSLDHWPAAEDDGVGVALGVAVCANAAGATAMVAAISIDSSVAPKKIARVRSVAKVFKRYPLSSANVIHQSSSYRSARPTPF